MPFWHGFIQPLTTPHGGIKPVKGKKSQFYWFLLVYFKEKKDKNSFLLSYFF